MACFIFKFYYYFCTNNDEIYINMKAYSLFIAILLGLMPYTVEAQGTEINSHDLRGKVVYQDDEVVFRQHR